MQRWLMAAVLLAVAGSTARADYFIIKVNLASTKDKKLDDPTNQLSEHRPGLRPGAQGTGNTRFCGDGSGAWGKGRGGLGGGPGAPGGGGGDIGLPGMGAGGFGQRGGPGGGRGFGQRGGLGGGALGGGMGMGIQGGGLGMQGAPPGLGGGALGGAAGGMGGTRGPAGSGNIMNQMLGDEEDKDSHPLFIGAVIEARHEDVKLLSSGRYKIKHKWGSTTLFIDNNDKEIEIVYVPIYTVAQQYAKEKARLKGVDLALWALAHGLYDSAEDHGRVRRVSPRTLRPGVSESGGWSGYEPKLDDSSLKWARCLVNSRTSSSTTCSTTARTCTGSATACSARKQHAAYHWFGHGKALPRKNVRRRPRRQQGHPQLAQRNLSMRMSSLPMVSSIGTKHRHLFGIVQIQRMRRSTRLRAQCGNP